MKASASSFAVALTPRVSYLLRLCYTALLPQASFERLEKDEGDACDRLVISKRSYYPQLCRFLTFNNQGQMVESAFARGLVAADSESIRTQVALWDDMKLWKLLWRKVRDSVQDEDLIREELNEKVEWLGQFSDSQIRVMLLTRAADHLDLDLPSQLTAGELDDLGGKIEEGAVGLLKENDSDFEGETTAEMAQHVMIGLFEDLAEKFEEQDEEVQQEIVDAIMEEIESMPEKQRERLREELDADELSRDAIRRAVATGALGAAFGAVVQMAGFSAYMAAVKALAAIAGMVGIGLPFGMYATLTSVIAFLANPLFMVPALLGGGWLLTSYTNTRMRNNLLPVVVTQSTVQASIGEYSDGRLSSLLETYNSTAEEYRTARDEEEVESYRRLEDKFEGISSVYA